MEEDEANDGNVNGEENEGALVVVGVLQEEGAREEQAAGEVEAMSETEDDDPREGERARSAPAEGLEPAATDSDEAEPSTTDTDEEEEHFDIALAASHSYMGAGLQPISGRLVLEAGWEGKVPVLAHHGAVFPGETVPMLLPHSSDATVIVDAIKQDKLFGLLCPDESGTAISGYGVLCEVFEADLEAAGPDTAASRLRARFNLGAAGGAGGAAGPAGAGVTFKARAVHRFRFSELPKYAVPMRLYTRLKYEKIRVLPEISPGDPLHGARLASLDPYRRGRTPLDRELRRVDAAARTWPLFVFEIFDYHRMRALIHDYFTTLRLADTLPEEPVSLSFWVARNLALSARDRLALFVVDNALLRLHMAVRDISRKSVLCCASCATEIARRDHIFAMSSEGVHSNYTNLGGYIHDIVTVSRTSNTELRERPSAEFSWFPGYTWTIAECAACMAHVGWRFDAMKKSLRPQQFWGLCRNYVTPRAADTGALPPLAPYALAPLAPPTASAGPREWL